MAKSMFGIDSICFRLARPAGEINRDNFFKNNWFFFN